MSRRDIIWITLESFRWDHTNFANHSRRTTPNLERLSKSDRGFVSNSCYSHGIYTRSSTASILTGRAASNHGVGIYRDQLPDTISTIPEKLSEQGYWNVCISPNGHISGATSLDRGFEDFRFITSSTILSEVPYSVILKFLMNISKHSGGLTINTSHHSISYLNNRLADGYIKRSSSKDQPMFLYLHYGDSHHPYVPPLKWRDKFRDSLEMPLNDAIKLASYMKNNLLREIANGCDFSDEEWNALLTLYDTQLAYVDHMVGKLVQAVRSSLDNPIIVITGDHGEHFGERGLLGHRLDVTKTLTNVPLVTYGIEPELDSDGIIQHADVWEIICEEANVELEIPGGVNPAEATRDYAVAQMGGERCKENLDKIQEFNPEFPQERFREVDLTAILNEDYIYRRSENRRTLCSHENDSVDKPQIESKFETWYNEWTKEYGRPVQDSDSQSKSEMSQSVRKNLEDMGYLIE